MGGSGEPAFASARALAGVAQEVPQKHGEALEGLTQSYEDVCRERIEAYLRSAQKYEQQLETNMSLRVKEWSNKLEGVLAEQEKRPFFDVRKYGEGVLHAFSDRQLKRSMLISFWFRFLYAVSHSLFR